EAHLVHVIWVLGRLQDTQVGDAGVEEVVGRGHGVAQLLAVQCHAVAGGSEVALVGDDADLGVHDARGGRVKSADGDVQGRVGGGLHGKAVEDGQVPGRVAGGAVRHHERPPRVATHVRQVPVGVRKGRLDVGEFVVSVAGRLDQ